MTREEIHDALAKSITDETVVQFSYLKPSLPFPELRRVSVYELSDDGETFLCFDLARGALRRFEIGRIVGDVEVGDDDYIKPIDQEV